jgi:O-antigen/teichoic acid export membrane protein
MSTSKHSFYNLVGSLLPIVISLATIPIYLGLIGDARYGVLAIAWLLLDYFGVFDLGLGRATAQRIATLRDSGPLTRSCSFWTATFINLCIGVVGGLLAWPIASFFFENTLSIENHLRNEMVAAIPWLILAVPLTTLSSVFSGALQGRQQFLELNIISTIGSALIQIVPLIVAFLYGPNLALLLPAVVLSKVVTFIILFWRCREHLFKHQPWTISKAETHILLTFGGWTTISSLVSPLMSMADRFAISATLGARFVTLYTVPFQLAQRSVVIPGALASALLPRLSIAKDQESRDLNNLAILILAVVMTPLMMIGMLLIEPFLGWWLNPEFAHQAATPAKILIFGFWINAFAFIPFVFLQASGRPDLIAKCHLIEIAPYILCLYVALHFFGLTGAAVIHTFRIAADCIALMYLSNNLKQYVILLLAPLVFMFTGIIVAITLTAGSNFWWIASFSLLAASMFWSFKNMPAEIRVFLYKFRMAIFS